MRVYPSGSVIALGGQLAAPDPGGISAWEGRDDGGLVHSR